jgi:hypothetical protein
MAEAGAAACALSAMTGSNVPNPMPQITPAIANIKALWTKFNITNPDTAKANHEERRNPPPRPFCGPTEQHAHSEYFKIVNGRIGAVGAVMVQTPRKLEDGLSASQLSRIGDR